MRAVHADDPASLLRVTRAIYRGAADSSVREDSSSDAQFVTVEITKATRRGGVDNSFHVRARGANTRARARAGERLFVPNVEKQKFRVPLLENKFFRFR